MKFILSLIFILLSTVVPNSFAQKKERFSKIELSNDIDSLYFTISDIHPFMFSHISRHRFEKNMEEIKQSLKDSMTVFEFYRQVAPLVDQIGDGHTVLYCPVLTLTRHNLKVFPFLINVNKADTVVSVEQDWSGIKEIIPSGATILSINGKKTKEIIDECLPLSEGELYHFKIEVLSKVFPFVFSCISSNSIYSISYKYKGKIFNKEVQGINSGQYKQNLDKLRVTGYSLSVDEKMNSAVIRFDEFGSDGNRFKNFLDSTFLLLKNKSITNLIIDLRYNGGGNSARGDELFQYISPVPFQQFGNTIVKVGELVYQRYGMPSKGLWIEERPLTPLANNSLRFNGHVYLLTSNFTFSSAASFAHSFKQFKMGRIVGEETGGLEVCFGNVFSCVLPNTGLNYGVSWQKYYLYGASGETQRGVTPDYQVSANLAMQEVMNLIMKKE